MYDMNLFSFTVLHLKLWGSSVRRLRRLLLLWRQVILRVISTLRQISPGVLATISSCPLCSPPFLPPSGLQVKKQNKIKKNFFFLNFTEFLSNFMITYDFNWFKVIPIWWMEWCLQPLQRPLQPIRILCLGWPLWPILLHRLNLMPLTQQGKF